MSDYALTISVPLPTGTKKYDMLAAESVEERAASLLAFESMEDLRAALDETQEAALRVALAPEVAEGADSVEVLVGEGNYLILAAAVEVLITEPELEPVAESATESAGEIQALTERLSLLEAGQSDTSATDELLREALSRCVMLAEHTLGLSATDTLGECSLSELRTLANHLYPKAVNVPTVKTTSSAAETGTAEGTPLSEEATVLDTSGDTDPALLEVIDPSLSEIPLSDIKPVTLADARKTLGTLADSGFRSSLRRGR